jgi:hypothetical protein
MRQKQRRRNVDWAALRELIAQGVTMRELAKTFDIPYRTLAARSYRERWNVMAIRANLPPRSKTDRKDAKRTENAHTDAIRNGTLLPLVKLANFYQGADVALLRTEHSKFLAFAHAAMKFLDSNDPKSSSTHPTINLQLLAVRPAELTLAQSLGAPGVAPKIRETESQSVDQGTTHEGNPISPATDSAKPAAD